MIKRKRKAGSLSAEEIWGEEMKRWLQEKVDISEIEREDVERFKEQNQKSGYTRIPEVPGGFQHERWEGFKAKIQDGDEVWSFCSPKESWDQLAGRAGYVILRKGEPVDSYGTIMS